MGGVARLSQAAKPLRWRRAEPHEAGPVERPRTIERVARLFVTKSAWAAVLAVLTAVCTISYPILPRQLTVVDALTVSEVKTKAAAELLKCLGATGKTLIVDVTPDEKKPKSD